MWNLSDEEKCVILGRLIQRTEFPDGEDGCWMNTYVPSDEYGSISIHGEEYRVHNVVHQIVNGGVDPLTDENPWVLHWCGKSRCWNPDHLYSGTPEQNFRDAQRHGTINIVRCGTRQGAVRHRQMNEERCELCRVAEIEAGRRYEKNRKPRNNRGSLETPPISISNS